MTDTAHHDHREDVSHIADHGELNPDNRSPENAENRGVWAVLTSSIGLAIGAMIVVALIAAFAFG